MALVTPIASLVIAGVSFAVTGGLLVSLVMATQPGTDSRISVETLASTTHPSPPKATTRSVSPSPAPSGQPWSIRVALFRPLPLKRIALGAGTVCRTRSTVPERLSQIQISDGLTMGSLPPLQCRGGWIHLNGMGYRDGVEIDRVQQEWQIIQTVELERYVASVVGAEMPSHWHPDALRAQGVGMPVTGHFRPHNGGHITLELHRLNDLPLLLHPINLHPIAVAHAVEVDPATAALKRRQGAHGQAIADLDLGKPFRNG